MRINGLCQFFCFGNCVRFPVFLLLIFLLSRVFFRDWLGFICVPLVGLFCNQVELVADDFMYDVHTDPSIDPPLDDWS